MSTPARTALWKSFARSAIRSVRGGGGFSALLVLNLGVAIGAALLAGAFVRGALSYDTFHPRAADTYRVEMEQQIGGEWVPSLPPSPLGPAVQSVHPGVGEVVRYHAPDGVAILEFGTAEAEVDRVAFADPSFFEVFGYDLVSGAPKEALQDPSRLVTNVDVAARLGLSVGDDVVADGMPYTVGAIIRGPAGRSHLDPEVILSYDALRSFGEDLSSWDGLTASTYLVLDESDPEAVAGTVGELLAERAGEMMMGAGTRASLLPVEHVFYDGQSQGAAEIHGDPSYLPIVAVGALALVLIASFNYANLTAARVLGRLQEVGIRRSIGASRSALVYQFLTESTVYALLAFAFGIVLAAVTAAVVDIGGPGVGVLDVLSPPVVVGGLLASVAIGAASGVYPALLATSADLDRSGTSTGWSRVVQRGLLVLQFVISGVLLVGLLVVQQQLSTVSNRGLGFEPEGVVVVFPPEDGEGWYRRFKDELVRFPNVEGVTTAPFPGHTNVPIFSMRPEGAEETAWVPTYRVDSDFAEVLRVEMAEGRGLEGARAADLRGAVLVNQTAARTFGWADPVGRTIERLDDDQEWVESRVVGVVEDFYASTTRRELDPLVIQLTADPNGPAIVRLNVDPAEALGSIRQAYERTAPESPFKYQVLEDVISDYYREETRLARVLGGATTVALGLAALGLLGLATLTARRRRREIGVRKVLGASARDIGLLLGKEYVVLVALSLIISLPVGWALSRVWLEGFSYQAPVGPEVALITAGVMAAVAVAVVAYRGYAAIQVDPAVTLREE